jgi:thiamine kinase-like enzyme
MAGRQPNQQLTTGSAAVRARSCRCADGRRGGLVRPSHDLAAVRNPSGGVRTALDSRCIGSVSCAGCGLEVLAQSGKGKARMQASDVRRAVAAAMSTASALDLAVDDAIVVHNSNKLTVRLLPCDVLARVAPVAHQVAQFEVELAELLAETESPVAALEPRVEPLVYERDGFVVTLWTYYEPVTPREVSPADYANALHQLHAGMRKLDVTTPHFTDRVAQAQQLVASRDHTPALADADRELLSSTLGRLSRAIGDRGAAEQLLHGEPHPSNVLTTKNGLLFVDLETCCRGPVEFDLAHVPEEVSERYPDADQALLRECRILVLAMVAAWRWDPSDQLPNGHRAARELLSALRGDPPWPALDVVMRRLGAPEAGEPCRPSAGSAASQGGPGMVHGRTLG